MRLLSPSRASSFALLSLLAQLVLSDSQIPLAADIIQYPLQDIAEPFSTAVASAVTLTTTEHITSTKYNVVAVVTMTRPQDFVPTTSRVDMRHSERALADMHVESQPSVYIDTLLHTTITFACSIESLIPQCGATQTAMAASKAVASESAATESLTSALSTSSASAASSVSPTSASSVGGSSLSYSTATTATAPVTGSAGVSGDSSTTTISRSDVVSSDTADASATVTLVTTVVSVSVLRVEETTYSIASTTTVTAGATSTEATSAAAAARTRLDGTGCCILALLLSIFHFQI